LISGIGLRAEFRFQGDRFTHVVSLIGRGEASIPFLQSVEGTAAEAWPASPPLQSLHIDRLPTGREAALLVGMAGRGHWSASIEAIPDSATLVFDIACRLSGGEPALASRYRLAAPGAKLFMAYDESWIESRCEHGDLVISPAGEVAAPCALKMLGVDSFAIAPMPQSGPTIRWRYFVRLLTPDS
jgi:hypothetical protein